MKININDLEMLLSVAEEFAGYGCQYVAFRANGLCDADNVDFFRNAWHAKEHCFVMTTDADYFKRLPLESLIHDMKTVLYSGMDLYSNEAIDLTATAGKIRIKEELLDNNSNTIIMNQKNLDFLADQIKYTGFGEALQPILKEQLEKGEKEFMIPHEAKFENSVLKSELNFKKSDQSDMYFFNSYKAMLSKEDASHTLEQIFYIGKENNFTMKEAFNLLDGRSVNKDLTNKQGEVYNAWTALNFKEAESNGNFKMTHYHQNYGYNLEAALEKHSIKELQTPKFKEDLISSLKKGNIQSVTVVINGEESKRFVEANPQFKTVRMYDSNLQRINDRESKEEKKSQSESKSESKEMKKGPENDNDAEQDGGTKKKQSRRQGASL